MDKPQLQAVLNNAGRMLTSILDLNAVLEQLIISLHAARLLPYDWLAINQLEGEEIRLTHTVGEDKNPLPPNTTQSRKSSAAGWAMNRGQPLLRHHLVNPTGFASGEPLLAMGIHSSLVIPLRVKGQMMGAWELGSRQIGAFRADDLDTAQSMADQLAIALENARLFE